MRSAGRYYRVLTKPGDSHIDLSTETGRPGPVAFSEPQIDMLRPQDARIRTAKFPNLKVPYDEFT